MSELPIGCDCGTVSGRVEIDAPKSANHLICYCASCQRFAQALDRRDVLDAQGGTDIIQLCAARVHFDEGRSQLACMQVTAGGPLRWYASCCRSPLANTGAQRGLAFAGVFRTCIRDDDATLDAAVGPVAMRVNARDAAAAIEGDDVHPGFSASGFAWLVPRLLWWRLNGAYLMSPFFDRASGEPIADPEPVGASSPTP